MRLHGFYFITDIQLSKAGTLSDVERALAAGVPIIQYRNKTADTRTLFSEAKAIKDLCTRYEAQNNNRTKLIINDRIDIALAISADGIHLGQEDLPCSEARKLLGSGKIIGATVHNVAEALEAQRLGADYVAISPIFATDTKKDAGEPCGVAMIREVKQMCRLPVVAIGGITLENAKETIDAGADSVVAMSAVLTKPDVKTEIEKFMRLF